MPISPEFMRKGYAVRRAAKTLKENSKLMEFLYQIRMMGNSGADLTMLSILRDTSRTLDIKGAEALGYFQHSLEKGYISRRGKTYTLTSLGLAFQKAATAPWARGTTWRESCGRHLS